MMHLKKLNITSMKLIIILDNFYVVFEEVLTGVHVLMVR